MTEPHPEQIIQILERPYFGMEWKIRTVIQLYPIIPEELERLARFLPIPSAKSEVLLGEAISLIEKGIENCPNRSHCLHVIFLASTSEGREELRQARERER